MFFGNTRKQKITTTVILVLIVLVCAAVYSIKQEEKAKNRVSADSEFTVHIIDVGQGNSVFIDNGDKDILIDVGDISSDWEISDYLDSLDVESIEYMFLTHPHEDHIGSADEVLKNYNVSKVVIPDADPGTDCFDDMLSAVRSEGAELIYASEGDSFRVGDAKINIFSPEEDASYSNMNLYSFIMRIDYEDSSFMFTGDAETENESFALENYKSKLDCDFLCVGHHGSSTSSSKRFLDAVTPEIAVISVGEGNQYGHPHVEILSRLEKYTDEVYRTDELGDIIICCDGEDVWMVE